MYWSDSEEEDLHLQRHSTKINRANYSSEYSHPDNEDLSEKGYTSSDSTCTQSMETTEERILDPWKDNLYLQWYSFDTDSSNYESTVYLFSDDEDLSQNPNSRNTWDMLSDERKKMIANRVNVYLQRYLFNNDSSKDDSPEYFYSEDEDLSQEGYNSSIDIGWDTDIEDDKYVIFNFYKMLTIKLFKKLSIKYLDITTFLQHLISSYSQISYGILRTEIDYTKGSNCVGYLHRYAACHAALVFDVVSDIFDPSSSDVLLSKLYKKSMKVMFLGGGPGNDLMGFLTALYRQHHYLFDLDVTVVDKMPGWESIFNETIESLRQGDGGKAGSIFEEVNVTTTYISADLKYSEDWDENLLAKLRNADIVFFIKVLSHIPDGDQLQVLKNVVTCMQIGSHLIYVDYPYPYRVFSSLSNHLRTVYQAWEMRYILGQKDYAFGCSNIVSSRAVVKVFARCEDGYSKL